MILKKMVFIVSSLGLSIILSAQQQVTKEQQSVQQTMIDLFDALSKRDSVSLKAHCTADITLYEYGQIWTIDTLIYKAIILNKAVDFKRGNSFEFINTIADKKSAWVTYKLTSVIYKDGHQTEMKWLETVFLVKERGQWKVKNLHSTLLERK